MFRKIAISLATVAVLGTVALAPTSASAFGPGKGFPGPGKGFPGPVKWKPPIWNHHHGFGSGGVGVGLAGGAVAASACLERTVIDTPYGPVVRWINVCY